MPGLIDHPRFIVVPKTAGYGLMRSDCGRAFAASAACVARGGGSAHGHRCSIYAVRTVRVSEGAVELLGIGRLRAPLRCLQAHSPEVRGLAMFTRGEARGPGQGTCKRQSPRQEQVITCWVQSAVDASANR
jgi:hypothetical protein